MKKIWMDGWGFLEIPKTENTHRVIVKINDITAIAEEDNEVLIYGRGLSSLLIRYPMSLDEVLTILNEEIA